MKPICLNRSSVGIECTGLEVRAMLQDVKQSKTGRLLFRYDPARQLVEIQVTQKVKGKHYRVPVLVDLVQVAAAIAAQKQEQVG